MTVLVTKRLRKANKFDIFPRKEKKQTQYVVYTVKDNFYDGDFNRINLKQFTHTVFAKILKIYKDRQGIVSLYDLEIISDILTPHYKEVSKMAGRRRYKSYNLQYLEPKFYDANKLPLKYFMNRVGCSIQI